MPQDGTFGFQLRKPTPVVGWTLGILVTVWVVMALVVRFGGDEGAAIYTMLLMKPRAILRGQELWTLVTADLLHSLDDTDHLVFNAIGFYFFAPDLEQLWGKGKFILFMLLASLGGSAFVILSVVAGISNTTAVVGFSGVVMGVIAAWALTYRDREIFFFFFRIRGIHLLYVELALQALTALSFSRVSAAAHFGGMAVGAAFVFAQHGLLRTWWLKRRLASLEKQSAALRSGRRASGPALRVIKGGADDDPPKDKRFLN
jgi:membrane associated rhomboid family serine protease